MKCRIREIREKKGISIGQLARMTGLTGGSISLIERGFRNPNMSTILKIRDALGVPIDELFTEDENEHIGKNRRNCCGDCKSTGRDA